MTKVIQELEGVPVAALEILKRGGAKWEARSPRSSGGGGIFPLKILVY